MKKKIIIATILAALVAVPVFAAVTEQTQTQNNWYNQMSQNHQQMMQQAVDSGTITTDEAAQVNDHMQQVAPIMQKIMKNGGMMNSNIAGNGEMTQGCGFGGNINNKAK